MTILTTKLKRNGLDGSMKKVMLYRKITIGSQTLSLLKKRDGLNTQIQSINKYFQKNSFNLLKDTHQKPQVGKLKFFRRKSKAFNIQIVLAIPNGMAIKNIQAVPQSTNYIFFQINQSLNFIPNQIMVKLPTMRNQREEQ